MSHSTLPLFRTDDGWPYPDERTAADDVDDMEPDLDAIDLRASAHTLDCLTASERDVVCWRFGLQGNDALAMGSLARRLGCTRTEARAVLGTAIDKLRVHLRDT